MLLSPKLSHSSVFVSVCSQYGKSYILFWNNIILFPECYISFGIAYEDAGFSVTT